MNHDRIQTMIVFVANRLFLIQIFEFKSNIPNFAAHAPRKIICFPPLSAEISPGTKDASKEYDS
jgi:hypothetical protein